MRKSGHTILKFRPYSRQTHKLIVTLEKVENMVNQIQRKAKSLLSDAINTVKNNPIPTVLIGIGIGWMLLDDNGSDDDEYDYYRDRSLTTEDRIRHYGLGEGRYRETETGGNVTARMSDTADAVREWFGYQVDSARGKVPRVVEKVS